MNIDTLETRMVRYSDLLGVYVRECGEPLVPVTTIPFGYIKPLIEPDSPAMFVRKTVADKLLRVQKRIQSQTSTLSLFITYGWRSPMKQTQAFRQELIRIIKNTVIPDDAIDLYEAAHRRIAVPAVAGHPTGGAIDVMLVNNNLYKPIDFGSRIYDFSTKKAYVFSPDLPKKIRDNRMLLRSEMMSEGFAPFDGEWWHFSYGDREWAYYYKKTAAIYAQISRLPSSCRTIQP